MKDFEIPEPESQWLGQTLSAMSLSLDDISGLKVEASHRTFYRLSTQSRDLATTTLIFMRSPPALEANEHFVALADAFTNSGVSVPRVLAKNMALGCFLLTDLGQTHLQETYGTPLQSAALSAAINQLSLIAPTTHPKIGPYDTQRLHNELIIFEEWFQSAYLTLAGPSSLLNKDVIVDMIDMQPKCCVHRDYHSRNLLYNEHALGVVDFQDALNGPVLYDIASLLRDCYHFFNRDIIEGAFNQFLQLPHVSEFAAKTPRQALWRQFDYTAIQRQLKAIGIFARLSLRDSKHSHLPHIRPNLARTIQMCATHEELAGLKLQLNDCMIALNAHPNHANNT